MNEQRIREIANQCSYFAEQIPFFHGIENGLTYESTIQKARDLMFAELIIKECMQMCDVAQVGYITHGHDLQSQGCQAAKQYIADWFEVEK